MYTVVNSTEQENGLCADIGRFDFGIYQQNFNLFLTNALVGLNVGTKVSMDTKYHKYTYDIINAKQQRDDITINSNFNTSGIPNSTFFLFARKGNGTDVNAYCYYKMFRCKIFDKSNILQKDFVPALRASDSKPGLYDLVTDTFYTNSGTGEFSYGSIVSDTPNIFFEDNPLVIDVGGEALLTANLERAASLRYKINGVWKYAIPYIKLNGNWYKAIAYRKTNGVWKQGI